MDICAVTASAVKCRKAEICFASLVYKWYVRVVRTPRFLVGLEMFDLISAILIFTDLATFCHPFSYEPPRPFSSDIRQRIPPQNHATSPRHHHQGTILNILSWYEQHKIITMRRQRNRTLTPPNKKNRELLRVLCIMPG